MDILKELRHVLGLRACFLSLHMYMQACTQEILAANKNKVSKAPGYGCICNPSLAINEAYNTKLKESGDSAQKQDKRNRAGSEWVLGVRNRLTEKMQERVEK